MLKLRADEGQKQALLRTMEAYSVAFNMAADWGLLKRLCNHFDHHYGHYREMRSKNPELNAGHVQSASYWACQALRIAKMKFAPRKKLHSCIRLYKPCIRIILNQGFCSLSTVEGRQKFNFYYPEYFHKYDGWKIKSTMLLFRKNEKEFYLGVVVQKENEVNVPFTQVLGIDRGLRNLAVTSDNRFFNSKKINGVRGRFAYNRTQLQAKGTRSAKRKLKKMAGRERRFVANINHCI